MFAAATRPTSTISNVRPQPWHFRGPCLERVSSNISQPYKFQLVTWLQRAPGLAYRQACYSIPALPHSLPQAPRLTHSSA